MSALENELVSFAATASDPKQAGHLFAHLMLLSREKAHATLDVGKQSRGMLDLLAYFVARSLVHAPGVYHINVLVPTGWRSRITFIDMMRAYVAFKDIQQMHHTGHGFTLNQDRTVMVHTAANQPKPTPCDLFLVLDGAAFWDAWVKPHLNFALAVVTSSEADRQGFVLRAPLSMSSPASSSSSSSTPHPAVAFHYEQMETCFNTKAPHPLVGPGNQLFYDTAGAMFRRAEELAQRLNQPLNRVAKHQLQLALDHLVIAKDACVRALLAIEAQAPKASSSTPASA